jgi:hypothetical protein
VWPKVTQPKVLGGLGIHDLQSLSWALRARWTWLQRMEPNKPWAHFQIQISKEVQGLVDMAMVTVIGDGCSTFFWKDKWFNGKRIKDPASSIYAMVHKRVVNKRKVSEAICNQQWISDFRGALSVPVITDFFQISVA